MSFVYYKDGKFLRVSTRHTHTGKHVDAEWVDSQHCATLFNGAERDVEYRHSAGAVRLQAKETRHVTIIDPYPQGSWAQDTN